MPVEPEKLPEFLTSLEARGLAGCNVTIPHKEMTYTLVRPADEATERLAAVNTVFRRDGVTWGTNTDGEGFLNSLNAGAPDLTLPGTQVVILGAGGASVAIVNALLSQGVDEVIIVNRSLERAEALRQRFGSRVRPAAWEERSDLLSECSLLVNATSLGMAGQPDLDVDLGKLNAKAVVTDIVYTPLRTRLLAQAAQRGNTVVEGLGMLLHQAVRGFELWFGKRPEVTAELHDLIARDVNPAHQR